MFYCVVGYLLQSLLYASQKKVQINYSFFAGVLLTFWLVYAENSPERGTFTHHDFITTSQHYNSITIHKFIIHKFINSYYNSYYNSLSNISNIPNIPFRLIYRYFSQFTTLSTKLSTLSTLSTFVIYLFLSFIF